MLKPIHAIKINNVLQENQLFTEKAR